MPQCQIQRDPEEDVYAHGQDANNEQYKQSSSAASVIMNRSVPGHSKVTFKLITMYGYPDSVFKRYYKLSTVNFDWSLVAEDCKAKLIFTSTLDHMQESVAFGFNGQEFQICEFDWVGFINNIRFQVEPLESPTVSVSISNRGISDFAEISVKPSEFGGPDGRFTLKSVDGKEFHVHHHVMSRYSPMLKVWMQNNNDGIRDGVPLQVECSAAGLESMLHLIYLNKNDDRFNEGIVGGLKAAHLLQMTAVVAQYTRHMCTEYKDKDFDGLMSWFLVAAELSLQVGSLKVETHLLARLIHLSRVDRLKMEQLKLQIAEYMKVPREGDRYNCSTPSEIL